MRKIYKYQIPGTDYDEISMPKGAKILAFQVQRGVRCIWALVDPEQPFEPRKFRFAGTNHEIEESEESLIYIGTCQMAQGAEIGHLFEIKPSKK